ncbi:hypothetical protein MLD38_017166 [Melastoma candidum]|uniref:Uncharacterized protein n=1 Tax=Melastoma candidum TaxID=119954 RepID=A0ACB9QT86_9MYRT|nr:hypothetical protein MLD38_017166 [Melastoma candidum]
MSIARAALLVCAVAASVVGSASGEAGLASWYPLEYARNRIREFEQKTDRFWEFDEITKNWIQVRLPYVLLSCVNGNCTKVGSIEGKNRCRADKRGRDTEKDDGGEGLASLSQRKRMSMTRISETSIWVTGESGSIYERYWNGVRWVTAPHDLPVTAGGAVSVLLVNQTILALSETGQLHRMQLSEGSHPIWTEFPRTNEDTKEETSSPIKLGVVSNDGMRVYFCTRDGVLLELAEADPPRWLNHGRPPGADVAVVGDAASMRHDSVFTISSKGELYEYDGTSRPPWKKHVKRKGDADDDVLGLTRGCTVLGPSKEHPASLFLVTKGGSLIERQLYRNKWKWIHHGSPQASNITSITAVLHDNSNEMVYSLFCTTATGEVIEYKLPRVSDIGPSHSPSESWMNHAHPPHGRAARGIAGIQLNVGRILFYLDDGRLAELHLPGFGGESSGPSNQGNTRKKSAKYVWSALDAPESEGWNAEYCTEERGPTNCVTGIKDKPDSVGIAARLGTRWRKTGQPQESYLIPGTMDIKHAKDDHGTIDRVNSNYRLRLMHPGGSFFLVTDGGFVFEYLYAENMWFWLRHDHSTVVKGAIGSYNGSLFLVDEHGSLLIREKSNNELTWVNCTAMRKGRRVIGGPPWDAIPGKDIKVTEDDALFFVSRGGRLMQFIVYERQYKWKDCRSPPNTRISHVIDQELFRRNLVFVVGTNGRLYQYNRVTELWHEHYQSPHLVLSGMPGSVTRPSQPAGSLEGSIFILSSDGGLVEYWWNIADGWNWVEHGTPLGGIELVAPPGPCFDGKQLFLIGSDGNVHLRFMDRSIWMWKILGHPYSGITTIEDRSTTGSGERKYGFCVSGTGKEDAVNFDDLCNPKVAAVRPIPLSDNSIIFELRDGRLAEMVRVEGANWVWSRIIGTPTSSCVYNYQTDPAS